MTGKETIILDDEIYGVIIVIKITINYFPKTTKNWRSDYGNFPNESLCQEKMEKMWRKCGPKLRTSEPRSKFTSSYKKECTYRKTLCMKTT